MMKRIILFGAIMVAVVSAGCTIDAGSKGTIDLSTIPTSTMTQPQNYGGAKATYVWVLNLCTKVSQPPAGSAGCAALGGDGYLQQFGNDATAKCEADLNQPSSPSWTYDPSTGTANGVFQDSVPTREADISISCGGSSATLTPTTSDFPVAQNSQGVFVYTIKLQSSVLCGGGPGPGPNPTGSTTVQVEVGFPGGAVFVILFFVGIVCYAVGMLLWNKFKMQKEGKELLPHPEFWAAVPGHIADGHRFVFNKARGLCNKGGDGGGGESTVGGAEGGYEKVG